MNENRYKCSAGHISQIDFGEAMKKPCPVSGCGISVYKFTDHTTEGAGNAADVQSTEAEQEVAPGAQEGRIPSALIIAAIVGVLAIGMWYANAPKTSNAIVTPLANALPPVAKVEKPVAHRVANNIEDVSIVDLKAVPAPNDTVKVSFVLVNRGPSDHEYPAVVVHWRGSKEADTVLQNDTYAHPSGAFTQTRVDLELQKPSDAIGIEVTIKY